MEIYAANFIKDEVIASTTVMQFERSETYNYMLKIFPVPEQMKQINKNDKEACNPNSAPKDHGYFLGQMVAAARKRINDKFSRSAKTKVAKMPKLHIAGVIAGMDKIEEKANLEWAQWSGFGFNPSSIK